MRTALLFTTTLVLLACSAEASGRKSYRGYQVLRVHVANDLQAKALRQLQERENLDFWTEVRVGGPADIMVSPTKMNTIPRKLRNLGLGFSVMIKDLQPLIDAEAKAMSTRQSRIDHTSYHTLEEIYEFYDEVAAANSADVSVESIGQSYEGRDMRVIKICKGGCGNKPGMWIQAGIHAREWISPAVSTYMVDQLAMALTAGNENADLVDNLDWYFLPSVNPDGYAFTQSDERMWRKTREPNGGSLQCIGTDANRNYEYQWNQGGSSSNTCSDTYMGASAMSCVENQNIDRFIRSQPEGHFQFFQDLHSYSQLVLLPFGYDDALPPDYSELLAAFNEANDALYAVHQKNYDVGNTFDTIYEASGIAVDWGYGSLGIKYSVSVELRDTGNFGFLLPPSEIIPTGEEMLAFHASIGRTIINENKKN